jgi:hypothetical protein
VSVAEPMTLATDYLVALVATIWGARVLRHARAGGPRVARWWAAAFAAVALAALAGGTHHGFAPRMAPAVADGLWTLTVLTVGVVGFALVGAAVTARFRGPLRRALLAAAAVELAVYAAWMAGHDEYLWVIAHYGASMAVALALAVLGWLARRDPAAPWIAAAVLVSLAAAAVQASGLALHRHFNHNDLYHLIQIAGLYLFHRGALLSSDAGDFTTSP